MLYFLYLFFVAILGTLPSVCLKQEVQILLNEKRIVHGYIAATRNLHSGRQSRFTHFLGFNNSVNNCKAWPRDIFITFSIVLTPSTSILSGLRTRSPYKHGEHIHKRIRGLDEIR